jgi:hypothetical protein
MRAVAAVLATVLLAALCGCGTEGEGGNTTTSASDKAAAEQKRKDDEAAAKRLATLTARYQNCANVSRALDTKLNDLNSRLSVGLPFADYSKAVGDVRVAYDRMFKQLGKPTASDYACLTRVLAPLEGATNAYASAYNVWNDCIGDYNCTFEGETLKKAQESWKQAATRTARAERGLKVLNPND